MMVKMRISQQLKLRTLLTFFPHQPLIFTTLRPCMSITQTKKEKVLKSSRNSLIQMVSQSGSFTTKCTKVKVKNSTKLKTWQMVSSRDLMTLESTLSEDSSSLELKKHKRLWEFSFGAALVCHKRPLITLNLNITDPERSTS